MTGCDKASGLQTNGGERRDYAVRGVIRALEPDGRTVVIQHEAVSNYMGAMTMPFEVRDAKELGGLRPGDLVSFHIMVTSHDGWIEKIVKLSNAPPATGAPAPAPPAVQSLVTRALAPLGEGDRLPDYHFTNELGQAVHLEAYRGQVIALTFFFTKCPFPTACPLLSEHFSSVQEKLPLLAGAPTRWRLLSITFDPANDTPAALLDYARRYHYDPARWSFLTGSLEEITELADQCGEEFQNDGHTISHSLRTVVVDAEGRVRWIMPGNAWSGDDLAREMVKAAQPQQGAVKK
ncbi:MAG: SCO family protein [Verrucomicrobiota bacterium]